MRARMACALWLLALVGANEAAANWKEPVAGSLNAVSTLEGESANIADVDGTPYVVWDEDDGTGHYQVRVKRLDAGGWTAVGGSLNADTGHNAFYEDIAGVGGVPYVVFAQDAGSGSYRVYVKRLEAGSWTAVGGVQNVSSTADAETTSIVAAGGVPYIAWRELGGGHYQLRVKRLEGGAFVSVGDSLNLSPTQDAQGPSLGEVAGVPYVTWTESDGIHYQVRVKRLEGNAWVSVGGSLNVDPARSPDAPSIAGVGGVPYVAWSEDDGTAGQLRVKRFDGAAWQSLGGSLNVDPLHFPSSPTIAGAGGTPLVTWSQDTGSGYRLYVKRWDGAAWDLLAANPLNIDASMSANEPETVSIGGVPYVAFDEYDASGLKKIRVKRLEPDIGAESATPTATGATLTAQVDDFGLALPIGFEFGTTAAFGTQTPLQSTTGAGASTVTQDIAGLTPQTSYSFRAFGSDGVRQTALGATQTFATLAAGGGPPPPPGVPVITNLKLTPATFLAAKGTVVTYDDSVTATTTLTVQRPAIGRRKGGACVKARRRPPKSKRCTRYVRVRSFRHADVAGHNRLRLRDRKLKPGAYRLRAVPRNAAGAGKAATRRFRIKRR